MFSKLFRSKLFNLALMILFVSATALSAEVETLGKVHFPVSCSANAQTQFDRAVAMLHNFWYPQDLDTFTEITETEPTCVMAYWGIAMSLRGNPLVSPPDDSALERGTNSISKALTLEIKTQRERDYLNAMDTYYKDWKKKDHHERVLAYENSMKQLYQRYPQDFEAAVFYALAINEAAMVSPPDKNYAKQMEAAAILEKVLASQPDHPGALHYLIHTYDFPSLANRGLPAARRYAQVAPSAPHALHMPSHIYSMLGMWQDSIQSNQAALDVAKEYVHAMDFMIYAYLQGGQDLKAKSIVEKSNAMQKVREAPVTQTPTGGVLSVYTAFAAIPARYVIERGAWQEAVALEPQSIFPAANAITRFTRAMGFVRTGNTNAANKEAEELQILKEALLQSKQVYWAEQVEIQRIAASAWIAYADRKTGEALKLMILAADMEDRSEKNVAMENRLWPMRELLGEMLLELEKPAQAMKAFESSLLEAPNRYRGFYGAARAALMLGDRSRATNYYQKLVTVCSSADTERPELIEAKAFLAKK